MFIIVKVIMIMIKVQVDLVIKVMIINKQINK